MLMTYGANDNARGISIIASVKIRMLIVAGVLIVIFIVSLSSDCRAAFFIT